MLSLGQTSSGTLHDLFNLFLLQPVLSFFIFCTGLCAWAAAPGLFFGGICGCLRAMLSLFQCWFVGLGRCWLGCHIGNSSASVVLPNNKNEGVV